MKQRYEDTFERQAIFFLSNYRMKKWLEVRWKLLEAYHNGTQKEILPCMKGYHYWEGKKVDL